MIGLLSPDGNVYFEGRFGRGQAGLYDPTVSKEQFDLSAVESRPDVLTLKNLGVNSLVVEKLDTAGSEVILDLLERGDTALLTEGTYFYLPSKKHCTLFTVVAAAANLTVAPPQMLAEDSTDDSIKLVEPEAKRARIESDSLASSSSAKAGDAAWVAPFSLLRVQGIPEYANRPPTGMRLRHVVCGEMKWVLVSNFEVDMRWLLSALPELRTAGQVVVVHGESQPQHLSGMHALAKAAGVANMVLHAPPLPIPYGTHHSKAFLVEYEQGLRLVVHTANLVHSDNNYKTQGLWVQDFPKKDCHSPSTSRFEKNLADYLAALKLPGPTGRHALKLCRDHDFSSARVHLLPSVPGYHQGEKAKQYGHMSLRCALQQESWDPIFQGSPVFSQFSSLGSLDAKWLHQEFQLSLAAGNAAKDGQAHGGGTQHLLGVPPPSAQGLQLIWPAADEVQNSIEGWAAGRSIPGFAKNVTKPFLQSLWHRFGGSPAGRQRAMPHIKSYGRYRHVPGEGTRLAWFALASHNLSKAAWGTLQKNGTQLMVRSYELGVLFSPSLEAGYRAHRHCGFSCIPQQPLKLPAACQNASIEFWAVRDVAEPSSKPGQMLLPVPYKLPPSPYGPEDVPWMVDRSFPGMDGHGRTVHQEYPPLYGHVEAN